MSSIFTPQGHIFTLVHGIGPQLFTPASAATYPLCIESVLDAFQVNPHGAPYAPTLLTRSGQPVLSSTPLTSDHYTPITRLWSDAMFTILSSPTRRVGAEITRNFIGSAVNGWEMSYFMFLALEKGSIPDYAVHSAGTTTLGVLFQNRYSGKEIEVSFPCTYSKHDGISATVDGGMISIRQNTKLGRVSHRYTFTPNQLGDIQEYEIQHTLFSRAFSCFGVQAGTPNALVGQLFSKANLGEAVPLNGGVQSLYSDKNNILRAQVVSYLNGDPYITFSHKSSGGLPETVITTFWNPVFDALPNIPSLEQREAELLEQWKQVKVGQLVFLHINKNIVDGYVHKISDKGIMVVLDPVVEDAEGQDISTVTIPHDQLSFAQGSVARLGKMRSQEYPGDFFFIRGANKIWC